VDLNNPALLVKIPLSNEFWIGTVFVYEE